MLLGSYGLLLDAPASFVRLTLVVAFSLVVAVTIHEFSHALVANGLGDTTAKRLGRLSLNPIRHLDPSGTVMMLVAGFGWGKPVPIDPRQLAHGNTGTALVAAAGPLSNLVLAFVIAVPIKLGALGSTHPDLRRVAHVMTGGFTEGLADIAGLVILFNLLLAVFNLIPLAPLDGSKVMAGFVPAEHTSAYNRLQQSGPAILIGIILLDFTLGLGILWGIIGPVVRTLTSAAIGG
ncbi:MAG: hypothetical protein BZY75_02910 [SAR202 cluster bacterium Io17-Chloro-G7]|nr:MAG: hypothetical protein BZY75_02910 [SAR202 cluster bacterium Io17-Chloro-G7]